VVPVLSVLGRLGQDDKSFAKAQETLNELRDLVQRQQSFLDQTFRRSQRENGGAGQPGEGASAQDAKDAAE
jgi:hypothetical protein